MKSKIINIEVKDIRFPTSKNLDGSDAMNAISDYSATYVTLRTDANDDLVGNGLTFTIGRGNELCVQAVKSLSELFVQDRYLEDITANFGRYW
ncbi:TPA: fuconate dehydratase, partial [Yersinia enterocolitica]